MSANKHQHHLGLWTLLLVAGFTFSACGTQGKRLNYPHRSAMRTAHAACKRLAKTKLALPLKTNIKGDAKAIRRLLKAGKYGEAKAAADELAYRCTVEARARDDVDELIWQFKNKPPRRGRAFLRFRKLVEQRNYADAVVCGEALLRGIPSRCNRTSVAVDNAPRKKKPSRKRLARLFRLKNLPIGGASSSSDDDTSSQKGDPLKLWGWISAGTGAAMLVTGAILGGVAMSKHSDLEGKCPPDCPKSEIDSGENFSIAADALFTAGGIAAAAGGVMLFLHYSNGGKKALDKEKAKQENTVGTRLVVTPGGIGIVGRF